MSESEPIIEDTVEETVEGLYKRVNTKGKVYLACALIIRDGCLNVKNTNKE